MELASNVTNAHLVGMAAAATDDVWALAFNRKARRSSGTPPPLPYSPPADMPALLGRTGGHWRRALRPTGRMRDLWVAGPVDVWTGGDGGLVQRWVAGRWYTSFVGRPDPLHSVWATEPTDIWVHGFEDAQLAGCEAWSSDAAP